MYTAYPFLERVFLENVIDSKYSFKGNRHYSWL